jgi:hypothetical protein
LIQLNIAELLRGVKSRQQAGERCISQIAIRPHAFSNAI